MRVQSCLVYIVVVASPPPSPPPACTFSGGGRAVDGLVWWSLQLGFTAPCRSSPAAVSKTMLYREFADPRRDISSNGSSDNAMRTFNDFRQYFNIQSQTLFTPAFLCPLREWQHLGFYSYLLCLEFPELQRESYGFCLLFYSSQVKGKLKLLLSSQSKFRTGIGTRICILPRFYRIPSGLKFWVDENYLIG